MPGKWVTDELWEEVQPLLPPEPDKSKGGRPRADPRKCLTGILFVLRTGCAWNSIPEELAPSGPTCWRRLKEWTEAGVWTRLWRAALRHLGKAGAVDLSYAAVDSASVRAVFGGRTPAPIQRTGRKRGAKGT